MKFQPPLNPFSTQFAFDLQSLERTQEWTEANREDLEGLLNRPIESEEESDRSSLIPVSIAVIKSSTSLATNRWTYTCEPVEWDDTDKRYVTLTGTSDEFTAYNRAEDLNTSSVALHGYDLSTSDYTLAVQAIPDDTAVLLYYDPVNDVYSFSEPNELVVTCTTAADSMQVPTLYVSTTASNTTTSGTYAVLSSWGDPSVIDPNVFTWTKASALAEAGQGDYLVRWQCDATAATNDATLGVKAQYKIDAGSWTDIGGTSAVAELDTLASYATMMSGRGYVNVASGEALDLRLVFARLSGTGTPTIASGAVFFEVQRAGL